MRLPIVSVCLVSTALLVASCSAAGRQRSDDFTRSPDLVGLNEVGAGEGHWSSVTNVMTGREREAFFGLQTSDEKERFVATRGIDVRALMNERLSTGMSRSQALAALQGSYDREISDNTSPNRLYLTRYNGTNSTQMFCSFANDGTLTNWGSFISKDVEEDGRMAVAEIELLRRLNSFLEPGMGENEVLRSAREMQEQLTNFNKVIQERVETSTYQGSLTPSNSNYTLEADIRRIQAMASYFDSVTFQPVHRVRQGTLETWYSVSTNEATGMHLVVRYIFDGSKLRDWDVYHTDFLSFLR